MSGNSALLDTNGIIYLLQKGSSIEHILKKYNWIGVSIISKIEFLSYPNLSEADLLIFNKFLNRVELVELNDNKENNIIETIILLRKKYRIKLPDSIIAASAITNNATLVTADKDFQKIAELNIELIP